MEEGEARGCIIFFLLSLKSFIAICNEKLFRAMGSDLLVGAISIFSFETEIAVDNSFVNFCQ